MERCYESIGLFSTWDRVASMEKNNEPVLDDDGREEQEKFVQENDDDFGFTLDYYYFGRREIRVFF